MTTEKTDKPQPGRRDAIYSAPQADVEKFEFDDTVADVFDDMIQRSVPGYSAILAMIGVLAERYLKPGGVCYDLGSSLGGVTLAIHENTQHIACKIIAVDNSGAMVQRLQALVETKKLADRIMVRQEDIRDTTIENASVVVLNFTLQFLALAQRNVIIQKIYDGLLPGSICILSEKIAFPDNDENTFQIDLHHEFKKLHGYSELEISQKRSALENVLIPDTRQTHVDRLRLAGFKQVFTWFQCFNFVSIVAIK